MGREGERWTGREVRTVVVVVVLGTVVVVVVLGTVVVVVVLSADPEAPTGPEKATASVAQVASARSA
ncbi:MAG: hypothetical protein ACP5OV_07845 [Acidimicrobiales bacterium]